MVGSPTNSLRPLPSTEDAPAAATASGSQPAPLAAGAQAGKRPHAVHISVKADPEEQQVPSTRLPSWLSPNPSSSFIDSPGSNRAASSRLGFGLTRAATPSPGEEDDAGLPRPVPSTPSKERGHTLSTSHPSWFQQSLNDALVRLEVQARQRGLLPEERRGRQEAQTGPRGHEGVFTRTWRLVTAFLTALWIDPSASLSPGIRWQPQLDTTGDASRGGGTSKERFMSRFVDPFRKLLGMGRFAFLAVFLLLVFGLFDNLSSGSTSLRGVRAGKNALVALEKLGVTPERVQSRQFEQADPLRLRGMWLFPAMPPSTVDGKKTLLRGSTDADVTAIVLNWKRFDNVKLVVAYLCRFDFFRTVVIWNNNPDTPLSRTQFSSTHCPAHRLQIVNAPRNLYFLSRFLACASALTRSCYFQDDDWIVRPLRSMYAQYRRGLDGDNGDLIVQTDTRTSLMYGWEWCFYNSPLNTCFSWLGTGAFVSRAQVLTFLDLVSSLSLSVAELSLADNYFSTSLNAPPYVFAQSSLLQLPSPGAFSDGTGLARNKRYIQKGIDRVSSLLGVKAAPELPTKLQVPRWVEDLRRPSPAPLPPHPYAHHVRAANNLDTMSFITNVPMLPPPDAVTYAGGESVGVDLTKWEDRLGWAARGWVEGGELFADGERWAMDWDYNGAVDGDLRTAWRSPDLIRADDYIGLALLAPAKPSIAPAVQLHLVLESASEVLSRLRVEVSLDGVTWRDPVTKATSFSCTNTKHTSRMPDLSFPDSSIMSSRARAIRTAEQKVSEGVSGWLRRRKRRAGRLQDCQVGVSSRWGEGAREAGTGWQFVRVRSMDDLGVGWGVYDLQLTA